jgi:hypothetical protein
MPEPIQDRIDSALEELIDERDGGRGTVYETYGSAGSVLLEPVIALAEAARHDHPREVSALLDLF